MIKTVRNLILSTVLSFSFALVSFADQPPDPGGGPGSGDDPVGGGAPIGGGLIVLLSLAIGYGAKKVFDAKSKFLD
ncbi:MAG: hypothetical protein B6D61_06935 [Bacteroidetes bacterium 4484_249]|nr:MAG: hypothetical protein B6D61_06935 [Bacteroidetes bacterium 4484_249]